MSRGTIGNCGGEVSVVAITSVECIQLISQPEPEARNTSLLIKAMATLLTRPIYWLQSLIEF